MIHAALKMRLLLSATLLLGMVLAILPLPSAVVWGRPEWLLMIMIFWLLVSPAPMGVVTAFILGLILDLLVGTRLGAHALLFTLTAYAVLKLQNFLQRLPLWQLTLSVSLTLLLYLLLQYMVFAWIGIKVDTLRYWLPVVTSTLFWPLLYLILKDFQERVALA